jgi:hypothetical protein
MLLLMTVAVGPVLEHGQLPPVLVVVVGFPGSRSARSADYLRLVLDPQPV